MINSLCRIKASLSKISASPSAETDEQEKIISESSTIFELTARKANLCFEIAKRYISSIMLYQTEGKEAFQTAIRDEKRRILKFAYSLIASSTPLESIRPAFISAGLGSASPQETCEFEMVVRGTELAQKNLHPIVIMKTMTAFLGFSYFDETEKWLLEKFLGTQNKEELIIPGDMAEILQEKSHSAGQIALATRLAGPQLVAAALAGCPQEAITYLKAAAFDDLGSVLLDDEINDARNRLSSDEIADAQNAFLELLSSLHEKTTGVGADAENRNPDIDQALVSDVSNLILELDERILKTVLTSLDPKTIAALIQTMKPIAHDRLFSSLASSKGKKVLDALESSIPLSTIELTRKAQLFAQKILSEIAPKNKALGKPLPLPSKVRILLTSILSRE
jgi:hypothetical protein